MECLSVSKLPEGLQWIWEILCGPAHKLCIERAQGGLLASPSRKRASGTALTFVGTNPMRESIVSDLPVVPQLFGNPMLCTLLTQGNAVLFPESEAATLARFGHDPNPSERALKEVCHAIKTCI